jgi:hypothetical protein
MDYIVLTDGLKEVIGARQKNGKVKIHALKNKTAFLREEPEAVFEEESAEVDLSKIELGQIEFEFTKQEIITFVKERRIDDVVYQAMKKAKVPVAKFGKRFAYGPDESIDEWLEKYEKKGKTGPKKTKVTPEEKIMALAEKLGLTIKLVKVEKPADSGNDQEAPDSGDSGDSEAE